MNKMNWNTTTFAVIWAVVAISAISHAQVTVGTQDFSTYPTGVWTSATNPYVFGGNALSNNASILDSGTARGNELWVDLDLSAEYNSGFNIDVPMSGNVSRNIFDYEMEVYYRIDPSTLASLEIPGSIGLLPAAILTLYNANAPEQGTEFAIHEVPNYGNAITNGDVMVFTFSSDDVYLRYDKTAHLDASVPEWKIDFNYGFGGGIGTNGPQRILMIVDEVVMRYTAPPLVNPDGAPKGYQTTNDLTVTGTVLDGSEDVDILELHLDGIIVNTTSNMAADTATTTNAITYDAFGLATGVHTAAVKGYDTTGTNIVWYDWTFYVSGPPAPAETNPIGMYNINILGSTEPNVVYNFPVTNGLVAAAPPLGSNNWFNANFPNPWWFGDRNFTVSESSGSGILGDIEYQLVPSSPVMGLYVVFGWGGPCDIYIPFQVAASDTIWGGALAAPYSENANSADMDFKLNNLDQDLTYDLYLYFAAQDNIATSTTYTITTGYAPTMTALLTGGSGTNVPNVFVEGTNYTTITGITPIDGTIGFNLTAGGSGSGGLSALQLVVRKPDIEAFGIQSLDISGTTVDLSWGSQRYISYNVFGKSDLTDPWSAISNNIMGSATGTNTITVPMGVGVSAEFYKIEAN